MFRCPSLPRNELMAGRNSAPLHLPLQRKKCLGTLGDFISDNYEFGFLNNPHLRLLGRVDDFPPPMIGLGPS